MTERFRHKSGFLVFLLTNICSAVLGKNILILPAPGYSHVRPMKGIVDELILNFHYHVSILLTEKLSKDEILKDLVGEIIIYDKDGNISRLLESMITNLYQNSFDGKGMMATVTLMPDILRNFTRFFFAETSVMQRLSARNYTTVVMDSFFSAPFLLLTQKLSISEIVYFGAIFSPHLLHRMPSEISSIPEFPSAITLVATTFTTRLTNFVFRMTSVLLGRLSIKFLFPFDLISEYASKNEIDEFYHLIDFWSIYLLDQDVLLDYPRPLLPNIQYVGGLSLSGKTNKLPDEIQKFVDSAKDGVIVVTFGSSIPHAPDTFRSKLYNAFENFPNFHFIVKLDKTYRKFSNILQLPWIPQSDLLAEKKTKAFITHCGNSGQYEALYHGVPMIGIPICSDHFHNARRMTVKSYGTELNFHTFTSEELKDQIHEILYNNTFSSAIEKASKIYRSRSFNASQRAAYWVDHVTKFGSEHLRSNGDNLSLYQIFAIDLILFCVVVLVGILLLNVYLFRRLLKFLCTSKLKMD